MRIQDIVERVAMGRCDAARAVSELLEAVLQPRGKRPIARSLAALPPLPAGWSRSLHRTKVPTQDLKQSMFGSKSKGFDYSKYGTLSGTAHTYGAADPAQHDPMVWHPTHTSHPSGKTVPGDPRFSGRGVHTVVMDMPAKESNLHQRFGGQVAGKKTIIPPRRITGVINLAREAKNKEKAGSYPALQSAEPAPQRRRVAVSRRAKNPVGINPPPLRRGLFGHVSSSEPPLSQPTLSTSADADVW